MSIINNCSAYIIIVLSILCVISLALCAWALFEIKNTKKRFERFMRPNSKTHNVEAMLLEYLDEVKAIKSTNERVVVDIADINNRLRNCVQKVGIVRYNTFEDVGGDLSYAVAMLDESNNGIVFNSLYYREGCYTYGKPIINGESQHQLSVEETEAINIALKGEDRVVTRKKLVLKRKSRAGKKVVKKNKSIKA